MWTTHIIISHSWTTHIMFQDQVNHICINLNLTLYYICIQIMLQKLACHMAIIQNSGSKCTSMCIQKKRYMYISPLYIYSYLSPLSLPLSMSSEKSIFLFQLLSGDPQCWTRGTDLTCRDCRQTKICKLVYQPIKFYVHLFKFQTNITFLLTVRE